MREDPTQRNGAFTQGERHLLPRCTIHDPPPKVGFRTASNLPKGAVVTINRETCMVRKVHLNRLTFHAGKVATEPPGFRAALFWQKTDFVPLVSDSVVERQRS